VDYAEVAGSAAAVVSGPRSYELLEALADAVAVAVLAVDPRIRDTTVAVRKLEPPMAVDIASVGVRISRQR
jgi:dihydroneopterin aldolase